MDNKTPHYHHGRRERKRNQLLKSGFALESLPEHEVLEILLYGVFRNGDTNIMAHKLIKHFDNSLAAVMNAEYNELLAVPGLGEATANFICFIRAYSRLYLEMQSQAELDERFNSARLKEYCAAFFLGALEEEFHCLYLTDDLKLISREKVCTGRIGEVEIPVRRIVSGILATNCSRLVIAHNHPSGSCIPSRADVDSTSKMRDTCAELEVELIDHIVVGRDGVTSMKECGFAELSKKR
jgi:DNA repair protein RadC